MQKEEKGVSRTLWVVNQVVQKGKRGGGTEIKTERGTETESAVTEIKTERGTGIGGETGTEIENTSVTVANGNVENEGKIDTCHPQVIRRVLVMEVKKVRNQCPHNQRKVHRMGCE